MAMLQEGKIESCFLGSGAQAIHQLCEIEFWAIVLSKALFSVLEENRQHKSIIISLDQS